MSLKVVWNFLGWLKGPFKPVQAQVKPTANNSDRRDSTRSHREKKGNENLVAHMEWASTFITILPMPVVLIDKKGFVHHTNDDFNELVTIPFDDKRCPYVGRYFESASFRSNIENVSRSPKVMVIDLKIEWKGEQVKNNAINDHYTWTLSGSKDSDALVITGR